MNQQDVVNAHALQCNSPTSCACCLHNQCPTLWSWVSFALTSPYRVYKVSSFTCSPVSWLYYSNSACAANRKCMYNVTCTHVGIYVMGDSRFGRSRGRAPLLVIYIEREKIKVSNQLVPWPIKPWTPSICTLTYHIWRA